MTKKSSDDLLNPVPTGGNNIHPTAKITSTDALPIVNTGGNNIKPRTRTTTENLLTPIASGGNNVIPKITKQTSDVDFLKPVSSGSSQAKSSTSLRTPRSSLTVPSNSSPVLQPAADAALGEVTTQDTDQIIKSGDNTFIVKTNKDVYINTYEKIVEQKYITSQSSSGNPGGSNGQVQYNDNGLFGANSGLSYNSGTNTLTATNLTVDGNTSLGAVNNVSITGGTSGQILCTDGSGGLNWATVSGGGVSLDVYCSLAIGNGLTSSYGYNNFAIGYNTLYCNMSGSNNMAMGYNALQYNNYGDNNISIGNNSLSSNTYGSRNIAQGYESLFNNTSGSDNIAIGTNSLYCNTQGRENVVIGHKAGYNACTPDRNIIIGYCAGHSMNAYSNIAIGSLAMPYNTSQLNIALGDNALYCNVSGLVNIAIGSSAMGQSDGGYGNIAMGPFALLRNQTFGNIAIGVEAMCANTFGCYNVAQGYESLSVNCTGNFNTAIGYRSLGSNGIGSNNIGIGACAGDFITTGNNNTIIGSLYGTGGLVCTVLIGAGSCERIKVDNTGLCINGGSLFTNNGSAIYIKNTYEAIVPLSGATGVVTHDFSQGSIFNHTSIANNFTANFTNLNLTAGNATNAVLILNQGGTAYLPTAVQIGGVAQTINWQGGSPPTGNASQKDIVSFSITNISSIYTVFGQLVTFA